MKKLFFTLLMFVSMGLLAQQVDREWVLVEIGTGTGCPYCPGAAMGLDDLIANGDPVVGIEYHSYNSSDPFNTPEAAQRTSYYAISGYPTAQFDGEWHQVVGGSNNQSMYSSYHPWVVARMDDPTSFLVDIYGEHTGNLYTITIKVHKVAAYSGTNLKVRMAVTESNIPYNWQGQSEINYTERTMGNWGAAGTPASFNGNNDTQTFECTFQFDNSWVAENCEVSAWIQDDQNKYVLHSNKVMLNDLEPPAPTFLADFSGEPTDLCNSGSVVFTDESIGNPTQWHWTFEGGYPEQSYDPNPVVYYQSPGSYDVRLIISDGSETDTAFKENYINVHTDPTVTFDPVPTLCNQGDDPYELTQGSPAGGVYSGDYVSDGKYFHPTASGVGQFQVTYTYTDQYGCENSADQIITVDNCVGIIENDALNISVFPNPNNGIFTIKLNGNDYSSADMKVVDAYGKVVFEQHNIQINGDYKTNVDLSNQSQGVYFIFVSGDQKSFTKKFLLKK